MLNIRCEACGKKYNIKNVRVDEHWRDARNLGRAYCYCPHCDHQLNYVKPETVDLINNLTLKNIIIVLLVFVVLLMGEATETLTYIAPIIIITFGFLLAKKSKLKDHRIIGWLLVALFSVLLITLNA